MLLYARARAHVCVRARMCMQCGLGVFENKMIERYWMYDGNRIAEEWEKLNNKEQHNFYCVPETVRLIK